MQTCNEGRVSHRWLRKESSVTGASASRASPPRKSGTSLSNCQPVRKMLFFAVSAAR
jgi:hypothetical protein